MANETSHGTACFRTLDVEPCIAIFVITSLLIIVLLILAVVLACCVYRKCKARKHLRALSESAPEFRYHCKSSHVRLKYICLDMYNFTRGQLGYYKPNTRYTIQGCIGRGGGGKSRIDFENFRFAPSGPKFCIQPCHRYSILRIGADRSIRQYDSNLKCLFCHYSVF